MARVIFPPLYFYSLLKKETAYTKVPFIFNLKGANDVVIHSENEGGNTTTITTRQLSQNMHHIFLVIKSILLCVNIVSESSLSEPLVK